MHREFFKYFIHYIFNAKTRQRLLFLAIVGLFISSFSLLVLQSTMGGLQRSLIARSQNVSGFGQLTLHEPNKKFMEEVLLFLQAEKIEAYPELELELLIKQDDFIAPAVVHGLDFKYGTPRFLQGKDLRTTIVGAELLYKLRANYLSSITIISPSHVNSFLGDVPRQVTTTVENIIESGVPEIDLFHMWVRASLLHNLIRAHEYNKILLYSPFDTVKLQELLTKKFGDKLVLHSWEEQNGSLVWALNLETLVMVFLFVGMTLLVAVNITTGFMIFFEKIQFDLVSFWILGASRKKLERSCHLFIHLIGVMTTVLGLVGGVLFLYGLDKFAPNIMPDIFVDRKIPVHIGLRGLLVSFLVPYCICVFFSYFALKNFKREHKSFVTYLRAVG